VRVVSHARNHFDLHTWSGWDGQLIERSQDDENRATDVLQHARRWRASDDDQALDAFQGTDVRDGAPPEWPSQVAHVMRRSSSCVNRNAITRVVSAGTESVRRSSGRSGMTVVTLPVLPLARVPTEPMTLRGCAAISRCSEAARDHVDPETAEARSGSDRAPEPFGCALERVVAGAGFEPATFGL
jgi:hypothetical protein